MFSSGINDYSSKAPSKPRFDPITYDKTHVKPLNESYYEKSHPINPHYEPQSENFVKNASYHLQQFIKGIALDDILIIGILILLLNENKEDDYLILIILAVLLFT